MKTKPSLAYFYGIKSRLERKNTLDGEANKNTTRLASLHPTNVIILDYYVSIFLVDSLFNVFHYFQQMFGISLFLVSSWFIFDIGGIKRRKE